MAFLDEKLTEQFYAWERRGRGWQVFNQPVSLEPPFRPFLGHYLPETPIIDDGRRETVLSSFVKKLLNPKPPAPPPVIPEPEEEPESQPLVRDSLIELQTSLPSKLDGNKEAFEQFLHNIALCREPVAFELLGTGGRVNVQFVAGNHDATQVRRQLQAYFPEALFLPRESELESTWESCEADEMLAVEFGLGQEFMLPLANGKLDPFVGLVSTLAELQPNELALYQVLFQPAQEDWAESILRSVTDNNGRPIFVNFPELVGAAEEKIRHPLCSAVVRIAIKSRAFDRVVEIAKDLAASLRVFSQPQGNDLVPLKNDDYPFYDHIEDVLRRQSRRSGMLLNSAELFGFVHLPSNAVCTPGLDRETGKTKTAPQAVIGSQGLVLGVNEHAGQRVTVVLSPEQRVRHTHIIGASGTGKSTLLFNLIRQDIEHGEGLAVFDPHGDLVDRILGIIPENRINDVVLLDASDEEYSIGFNILSAHSELEKRLLASDLVSVFQRQSTSWGDQMGSVLQNAILAFLESPRGGTLIDLRRFLLEPAFQNEHLKSVLDPEVVYYWQTVFRKPPVNKSVGPVLTRLGTFLTPKPIRAMVSQTENRLDFSEIMDTGKIFLAKLPEGILGEENSYLLGALLISKFQQLVMSRQAKQISARRDFWFYMDEFANFITPSMATILSGARKYRIGLTLAHHELHQLQSDPKVASAVMSHPFTRIVFRVGDDDARKLAEGFSFFEAQDLRNLETGHAICRVERSDFDFNLTVALPDAIDETIATERQQQVIKASRTRYAKPRAEIDAMLTQAIRTSTPAPTPETPKSPNQITTLPLVQPVLPPPAVDPPPSFDTYASPIVEKKSSAQPPDLGRGGEQHKAIQQRLKRTSEECGFRAIIEKQILEGQGSVDLLLERDDTVMACEISVTTSIDHEVGNVAKCIKANFAHVVVICLEKDRLQKIEAAVAGSLGQDAAAHVEYYLPDAFIAHLKAIKPSASPPLQPQAQKQTRHGYKIKRVHVQLTEEELKARENVAFKDIAETMRKKQK